MYIYKTVEKTIFKALINLSVLVLFNNSPENVSTKYCKDVHFFVSKCYRNEILFKS